jgi:hypothetical protein
MMATAFCQTHTRPSRASRSHAVDGVPKADYSGIASRHFLALPGTIGPSQELAYSHGPASPSFFSVLPPSRLQPFSNKSNQRLAWPAPNFSIPRCGIFKPATCKTHPRAASSGEANKRSGFNTAQVGSTTRETGCANQDTCPFHLTLACLHLTRIQS